MPELEVLMRVATSMTRRHGDAENLVQDTLLRAYRSIESFNGAHSRAWLLTIMRNADINRNRRRRPELRDDPNATFERMVAAPSEPGQQPDDIVLGEQFDDVVASAFNALPEEDRRVPELVDIDWLSYAEAAQLLGVPKGTVMSRVHRARTRIRNKLATAGLAPRGRMMS